MSLKRKLKKAMKNIIGDLSSVEWRDLDHKKVYVAIAALLVILVLVIVLVVKAVSGGGKTEQPLAPEIAEEVPIAEETAEEVADENPLEVNANEAVNELVKNYFQGLSSGDIEFVASTVDVLTEEEKLTIERKKEYIEEYRNLTCYTKKGLEEDSYVVFAAYDMKIFNIETAAPGIMALYVCESEEGGLYIFNGEASEELTNYVLELAEEADVAEVIAEVDARYQQLVAEDEELGKFAETMLQSQKEETEEEPVEAVTGEGDKELEEPVKTTVNDGIRIREGRSTDTRVVATVVSGTEVKVYASYDDGWSKIEYSGTIGHCKTEFLASTEGVPMLSTQPAETTEGPEEPATPQVETTEESTTPAGTATALNKQMRLTDTIRIRKEPSTDSEVLATAYQGERLQAIESYSDGWCKVEYNGKTGYCKTEYLE